jgi:DNA topoisomerase-1
MARKNSKTAKSPRSSSNGFMKLNGTASDSNSTQRGRFRRQAVTGYRPGAAKGRHLVIVESPAKAKTINKYLGSRYLVLASVGHVRDLPRRNPKGQKLPVPGVDLQDDFKPTYVIVGGKEQVVSELKEAARESRGSGCDVWFATDLDREGEAIAWHLAQELGISSDRARRVVFPAITKTEIERAFANPHPINEDRVNAQQARRILDRIVGYQVSPLLWKKVARGLSAGRVQSVAVLLIVEREREIRDFVPEEYWEVGACFTSEVAQADGLGEQWRRFLATTDKKGNPPTQKARREWLGERGAFSAQLVEVGGEKFEIRGEKTRDGWSDCTARIKEVAALAGLTQIEIETREDENAKGPARFVRTVRGKVDPRVKYRVTGVETKRTLSRPPAPFITSTLQQAAASRLGFAAQQTMRAAQQLYEGVQIPGEGPVGLITYMRTDSTHLAEDAIEMARAYIARHWGEKYLPEKPNVYRSSNRDAQEAHEAIRPTSLEYPPQMIQSALKPDQFLLYSLIWDRFLACQMVPAQWDATTLTITGGVDPARACVFRASGRVLVFDGFYRAVGVPASAEEQHMPVMEDGAPVGVIAIEPEQRFTSPPARYSEASLIRTLEAEGIGRPSTYAAIIQTIQDRKYVEKRQGRFFATDLGEVVTDKLTEAIPVIMDIEFTRKMEKELDQIEEEHLDWVKMLRDFYTPFSRQLKEAEKNLVHAKAETWPAPPDLRCPDCGSGLQYRFGKNGRFLSCESYPKCRYASPIDGEGRPRPAAETVDVACPKCGNPMTRRVGKYGPFLGCSRYGAKDSPCDGVVRLDRRGRARGPSPKPLETDLPCPKGDAMLNLRRGARGPWLSCSRYPTCRGGRKWTELSEEKRKELEQLLQAHEKANPVPIIRTLSGRPLTDERGKPLPDAGPVGAPEEGAQPEEDDLAA